MEQSKLDEYLHSKSTSELAATLSEKLKDYRIAMTDPDATLSIPDMDMMCGIADEIVRRLNA